MDLTDYIQFINTVKYANDMIILNIPDNAYKYWGFWEYLTRLVV